MASNQGLNSLATIIKRLEAATSRLEDIAEAQAAGRAPPTITSAAAAPSQSQNTGSPPAASSTAPPSPPEDPAIVQAYDADVTPHVEKFVKLSQELNPVLAEQAAVVKALFEAQRALILQASACAKPSNTVFQSILQPLASGIDGVGAIKDKNRSNRDVYNHLCAVAEGIPALSWVTISPKPAPFVAEMKNATQFYSNRVMNEFKDKDKRHVEWTKSFSTLLEELRKYVSDHHTTGLAWNPKGQDPAKYTTPSGNASSAAAAPPPPPPPPAPAAPPPPPASSAPTASGGGAAAVFADINKGSDITKGLKHVSKDQMTHKNPELRASGVVPASTNANKSSPPSSPAIGGKKPVRPAKPSALSGKKPSKMALEGNKWVVEFFENDKTLVIDQGEINQSVNLFGCKNSTLQIQGKVNAVTLVNCVKTSVLIENVISAISITSSPSFTVQVTGLAPTIQLDSTDGGQIYLSAATAETVEIMTAKCSAINISVPDKNEQGEEEEGLFVERAVPEMIRVVVKDGKLVSSIVEPSG